MSLTFDSTCTVAETMVTDPKTMAPDVAVGDVREIFRNDHVHLVLLTESGILLGTLVREDLQDAPDDAPALPLAMLSARTIPPGASMDEAAHVLDTTDARRLAVIDDAGVLLGLLCLKRRRTGFCSDRDVEARAADGTAPGQAQRVGMP